MSTWYLDPIPLSWRDAAVQAIEAGDIIGFLIKAGNEYSMRLVEKCGRSSAGHRTIHPFIGAWPDTDERDESEVFSWTASLETAKWFANRSGTIYGLPRPAVYRVVVDDSDVLAYVNDRKEQEFVVLLPKTSKPELIWSPSPEDRTTDVLAVHSDDSEEHVTVT